MLHCLAARDGLDYDPQPLGLRSAREAISSDYRRRGVAIDPDRLVLTASTSEAYGWLFKLLCKPEGDTILMPVPSYPLFDHLTRLEGVLAEPYRLEYHGRWSIDFASLDHVWTDEVRGVLTVSPNNPTGSTIDPAELETLGERCAYYGAGLIVDEVFADYPLREAPLAASRCRPGAWRFRLGGLSKSAGLPQLKLGWIAVSGPDDAVARAMERLELICRHVPLRLHTRAGRCRSAHPGREQRAIADRRAASAGTTPPSRRPPRDTRRSKCSPLTPVGPPYLASRHDDARKTLVVDLHRAATACWSTRDTFSISPTRLSRGQPAAAARTSSTKASGA